MMTKSCNQHVPLHEMYGYNNCCLCNAENRIKELEVERDEYRVSLCEANRIIVGYKARESNAYLRLATTKDALSRASSYDGGFILNNIIAQALKELDDVPPR